MASNVSALTGARVRIRGRGSSAATDMSAEIGLSPRTFATIRWTQILGQLVTIVVVGYVLDVELPMGALLSLVAVGAMTTVWATRQLKAPHRLDEAQLGSVLLLDASLIGAMLVLTGALANPFALFLLVPAILAGTTLGLAWCATVCGVVVLVASILAFVDVPMLWAEPTYRVPPAFTIGVWTALTVGAVLIASYAWRIAEEGRRMGRALAATQLALEREQRLSHLDGLATAAAHDLGTPLSTVAILAKEISAQSADNPKLVEDARLLHEQVRRCRDILARFAESGPARASSGVGSVPLSFILERLCADHDDRLIDLHLTTSVAVDVVEPSFPPAGEVRHGLSNLLDNAVTYASSHVSVSVVVDQDRTAVRIVDDGPGFPPEILNQVGQPFVSTRRDGATHGLGLFIACTFLTRAGAELEFSNGRSGAAVTVVWPASRFEGKS